MAKHFDVVVERVAKALVDSDYPDIAWNLLSPESKRKWRVRANAALDAVFPEPVSDSSTTKENN